jgi:hypothetical protein
VAAENLVPAPNSAAAVGLADWVELLLLVEDEEEIARRSILRRLADEPLDPAGSEEDADVEKFAKFEARADRLLAEVDRRAAAAPNVYPFRVDNGLVQRIEVPGKWAYWFMLWLSWHDAPFRVDERIADSEALWDGLVRAALEVLVGPTGDSLLFAQRYNEDPPTDEARPKGFPEAINWLRTHLKLGPGVSLPLTAAPGGSDEVAGPDSSAGHAATPAVGAKADEQGDHEDANDDEEEDEDERDLPLRTYSDGGVDVVAWQHFRDGRAGFPVLLAQCTVQEKWRPKTRDVSLTLWRSWIDFPTRPQKLLVIPFSIGEKNWWADRNRLAGMILDRMRVAELLEECDDDWLGELSAEREEWLADELRKCRAAAPAEADLPDKPSARVEAESGAGHA